jgi:hypothetical protein
VEINRTRMCELLVGLPDVTVLAVDDQPELPIVVHIECRVEVAWCRTCGAHASIKDRDDVELVDLPRFGRPRQAAVAQAALAVPRDGLSGGVVDNRRPAHRRATRRVDGLYAMKRGWRGRIDAT